MAYIAEKYFGIADITGAYVAGIILCSIDDAEYIARKADVSSYMVFAPVFFASIGLKTNIDQPTPALLLFCVLFVAIGLITKIIGCGLMSKVLGFSGEDSIKIGIGMMTRGRGCPDRCSKGPSGWYDRVQVFTAVILLILASSVITPIFLKSIYSRSSSRALSK